MATSTYSRVIFINIGNSINGGDDYFDATMPGAMVFMNPGNCTCLYDKEVKIEKIVKGDSIEDLEQLWTIVAEHIKETNSIDSSTEFLAGLMECANDQDDIALVDYCEEEGAEVVFDDPYGPINEEIGLYCISQFKEGEFVIDGDKIILEGQKEDLNDVFGMMDDLEASLAYVQS